MHSSSEMATNEVASLEKVLRVSQLDASELDEELSELLQDQFLNIFNIFPSIRLLQLKPELRALVRFLIWKFSVHMRGKTFGQEMMDLNYSLAERQLVPIAYRHRWLLFTVMVLTGWLRDRIDLIFGTLLPLKLEPSALQRILNGMVTVTKSLSLLNFIVFLLGGRFPTLKERVLGLCMVPEHPQTLREASYEYMNREILWHGFSEFIFFILPHFNLFAMRNWLRSCLTFGKTPNAQPFPTLNFTSCAFCDSPPTMPYVTGCGHVYCYYCIRANCLADSGFPCSVCSVPVSKCAPASSYSAEHGN